MKHKWNVQWRKHEIVKSTSLVLETGWKKIHGYYEAFLLRCCWMRQIWTILSDPQTRQTTWPGSLNLVLMNKPANFASSMIDSKIRVHLAGDQTEWVLLTKKIMKVEGRRCYDLDQTLNAVESLIHITCVQILEAFLEPPALEPLFFKIFKVP